MNVVEREAILRRAIDVVKERGWASAPLREELPVCLTQAVNIANGGSVEDAWSLSYDVLGHDHARYQSSRPDGELQKRWPWVWNDRFGSQELIEAVLIFLADTGMAWDDVIELWLVAESLPGVGTEKTAEMISA